MHQGHSCDPFLPSLFLFGTILIPVMEAVSTTVKPMIHSSCNFSIYMHLNSPLNTRELSNFSPTLLFIATWDQVPQYSGSALVNSRSMVDCMLPHQECIRDESVKLTPVYMYILYTCLQILSVYMIKSNLHKHHIVITDKVS